MQNELNKMTDSILTKSKIEKLHVYITLQFSGNILYLE